MTANATYLLTNITASSGSYKNEKKTITKIEPMKENNT